MQVLNKSQSMKSSKQQQMCQTHCVSDAASPVATGGDVPGAEDVADSHADINAHTQRES